MSLYISRERASFLCNTVRALGASGTLVPAWRKRSSGWTWRTCGNCWVRTSRPTGRGRSTRPSIALKSYDIAQMAMLPARLREELAGRVAMGLPEVARRYDSADGTRRYLLRLEDGRTVETVLMPEGERDTLCISSQVGCAGGLQVLHDGAAGAGAQSDGGRDRGPGVAGGARQPPAAGRRPAEHRHDGAGRAAAEPGQRGEGGAHPARPGRVRAVAAAHHGFDGGDRSGDRQTRRASRCGRSWRSR